MRKIFTIVCMVLILNSLGVLAKEYLANDGLDVVLFAPDKFSVLDTFQVKLEVKDADVRKFANLIDFSDCNYFIYNNPEIGSKVLTDNGYDNPLIHVSYGGEKEIILHIGSIHYPSVSDKEETNNKCTIYFRKVLTSDDRKDLPVKSDGFRLFEKSDSKKNSYFADLAIIAYDPVTVPVSVDIRLPLPKENSVKSGVLVSGHTPQSQSPTYYYTLKFTGYGKNLRKDISVAENHHSDIDYSFDFKSPDYRKFFEHDLKDFDKKMFLDAGSTQLIDAGLIESLGSTTGFYRFYHSVYDTKEKSTDKEDYVSVTSYFMGRIQFHGTRSMPIKLHFTRYQVLKEDAERTKSEHETQLLGFVNTITVDDGNIDYPTYSKETRVADEKKDVKDRSFEIKFSDKGKKTIWNRGRINTGKDDDAFVILVKIDGKAYDENGKVIKKPSTGDLYSGVKLVTRILGTDESQIGFGSALALESIVSIDSSFKAVEVVGKGPHLYKSFYKPKEFIEVYLELDGEIISNRLEYVVDIKDASPDIKLKNPTIEVQDGDKRAIQFSVKDADKSKLTCYVMLPTDFARKSGVPFPSLSYDNYDTTLVKTSCKDGDTIKVMYHAPSFGNFDLNNELDALSMWKLQEDTMKTLLSDLVGFGVEKRTDSLNKKSELFERVFRLGSDVDDLKNAQRFSEAAEYLSKANDLATDAQNVIKLGQTGQNIQDLRKLGNDTVGTGKQGWVEWGADWGVFGIDIAQSTVGAIAMAPGKIPVLGPLGKKVGSGFTTAFNLMTNVWKGNLQYISKVEKIDRAKLMYFPYPVIITVEDEDGFVTKEIQNIMVVYNWLE